jgi:hypothetical protein
LFISFFFPNTRLQLLASFMFPGRWLALAAVVGIAALLCANRTRSLPHLAPLPLAMMLAFLNIGVLLPFSVNASVSMAKWFVFFTFLIFCYLFFSGINGREDALRIINPLVDCFLIFIWSVPLGIMLFPQWGANWRSYLRNPNAVGLYLAIFGVQAALFRLETATRNQQRFWAILHLTMATFFTIASGSRTSVLCILLVLGIAFLRFKDSGSRLSGPFKVFVFALFLVILPLRFDRFQKFAYKYPTTHSILESRTVYWGATRDAFVENLWFGSGFGVQSLLAEADLDYSSSNLAREQGSTYLGLLEETGLVGGLPLLLLFLALGLRFGKNLFRSKDPLQLLLSRVVVAGLIWGITEYYLLSLGNAGSLLVFFAFFAHERLEQMATAHRRAQHRIQQWQRQGQRQGQRGRPRDLHPVGLGPPPHLQPVRLQPGRS